MASSGRITILGVFVADTTYRASRLPRMGETLLGTDFALGPGGKGSNQAVAAARLGAEVHFITRLGDDGFAAMAETLWQEAGVTSAAIRDAESFTGAAFVFVEPESGDNAIIISPGAGGRISTADIDAKADLITGSAVFMTQLEQPLDAAIRGLEVARAAGVTTILNPAPAAPLDDRILALCDYVTPNETEAGELTGTKVETMDDATRAATMLRTRGAGAAVITLGANGVLLLDDQGPYHIPAISAGKVVETTGAGDAFNGGFAAALARGETARDALRYGCAVAGLAVTRAGTAQSMPDRAEVDALLGRT